MKLLIRSLALILVSSQISGCAIAAALASGPAGRFDNSAIDESSALVESQQYPGVFWTLNDSGNENEIFAIDAVGHSIATFRVDGAVNVDWESLALDDQGNLYIGDIGNNANRRRDLVVYRVREPNPKAPDAKVAVDAAIRFHYPDQVAFPDPERRNFDAEALFWSGSSLYVLTKHRSDARTTLYRFPPSEGGDVELIRIDDFDTGDTMVTAADATRDGRFLAVLTYRALYLFERPDDSDDYLSRPLKRIAFDALITKQCEGVAWSGTAILFTNEQGDVHRIEHPLSSSTSSYP